MPKRFASSTVSPTAKTKKQSTMTGFFARTNPPEVTSHDDGYKIFCDLDGVLCDFDAGVKKNFNGRGPDELHTGSMWSRIANTEDFYCNLPWMPDGRALWDAIRHLQPTILTGVPRSGNARQDKATWCRRELGVEINHVDLAGNKSTHCIVKGRKKKNVVNVITCWSKNKHFESGHRAVLIDDREDLKEAWETRGGIFVHHTNTEQTLRKLKEHGILSTDGETKEEDSTQEPVSKDATQESTKTKEEDLYDMPPDTP